MSPLKDMHGFTLMELLITMVIMAMALLALSALINSSLQSTIAAQRMTEAITCAEKQMEIIRADGYDTIAPGERYNCFNDSYIWWMETPKSISPVEDLLEEVAVRVEWADGSSELELRTMLIMTGN